jgi:4-hydroxybenzoate polyprenyltransferase
MRSPGCVINDYADRKIDKLIERTENRPITSGEIHPKSALILFFLLMTNRLVQTHQAKISSHKVAKNTSSSADNGALTV